MPVKKYSGLPNSKKLSVKELKPAGIGRYYFGLAKYTKDDGSYFIFISGGLINCSNELTNIVTAY